VRHVHTPHDKDITHALLIASVSASLLTLAVGFTAPCGGGDSGEGTFDPLAPAAGVLCRVANAS
jgi:hypothetical protein